MYTVKLTDAGHHNASNTFTNINDAKNECRMFVDRQESRIGMIYNDDNKLDHIYVGRRTGYLYTDMRV